MRLFPIIARASAVLTALAATTALPAPSVAAAPAATAAATAASTAAAAPIAPVTAVTLYPGGASVTRSLAVPAGAAVVTTSLGDDFDPGSLRIEGDAGIRVGQVEVLDTGRGDSPNAAQAGIEERIRILEEEQSGLDAESAAADVVKGYLDRLGTPGIAPGEGPHPAFDSRALAATIDVVGRSATEALARKRVAAAKKRALRLQVDALKRDLERARGSAKDTRALSIATTAQHAGALRLTYEVTGAGWQPAYRAELDTGASRLRLTRLAAVSQKTGEDWTGVKVVLSTSRPRSSAAAPAPQPWLLSYGGVVREAFLGFASAGVQSRGAVMERALAAAPPPKPMEGTADSSPAYEAPTFESDGAYETVFEVPSTVTLRSDGRLITLELGRQELSVKQRVQVAPRMELAAALIAKADRPEGVWPPGNVEILRDGNFVGVSAWPPQSDDQLEFSFGRDELVHVRLDHAKGDQGNTGLIERRRERRIADVYTISNRHPVNVDLLVLEAGPVATSDEITVDSTFDPKPGKDDWDARRGVKAWEKTLAPRESFRVDVRYTISYPRDGIVNGLN
jgi:uncharacterized protein (TIGR02231 family)